MSRVEITSDVSLSVPRDGGPLTADKVLDMWLDVRDALSRPIDFQYFTAPIIDPNVSEMAAAKADVSPALAPTTSADPNVSALPTDPNVSVSQE